MKTDTIIRLCASLGAAIFWHTQAFAQPMGVVSEPTPNYRFALHTDSLPWIGSRNPAGLLDFSGGSISFGEGYATHQQGTLRNYFEGSQTLEFGVQSQSILRFNKRVVGTGKLSYTNLMGQEMSGSVFINPYSRPFDISEFDQKFAGDKNLELYVLSGGVGIDIASGFSVGVSAKLNSANYTKLRDLRYKNSYSQISGTAAVRYTTQDQKLSLGLGYTFQQEVEGLIFSLYGAGNEIYRELINFGGFWGISSTYSTTSHNYIKNSRQPFIDIAHILSAQASFRPSARVQILVEGHYKPHQGFYGLDTQNSVVHTQHNGTSGGAKLTAVYSQNQWQHIFSGDFNHQTLENYRTVWRETSHEGGQTNIKYFDPQLSGKQQHQTLSINYTGHLLDPATKTPRWSITAGAQRYSRNTLAEVYPYFRQTKIHSNLVNTTVCRYFTHKKNTIGLQLNIGTGFGGGNPYTDGLYTTPSDQMIPPQQSDYLMQMEWDFLTSDQITAGAKIHYQYALSKKVQIYAQAAYNLTTVLNGHKNRHLLKLNVGCNF